MEFKVGHFYRHKFGVPKLNNFYIVFEVTIKIHSMMDIKVIKTNAPGFHKLIFYHIDDKTWKNNTVEIKESDMIFEMI